MGTDSVFIDDGQVKEFRVAGVPGLHGTLSGRYRPVLPEERLEFANVTDADGRAYARRAAACMADKILDWDAKAKGGPVPKSAEALLKLHPSLFVRLLDQVLGYKAADAAAAAKNSPTG
jgi:hypothetical protein